MGTWRIYYDDGSTFTGRVEDTPAWGVLVVLDYDRLVVNADYYVWDARGAGPHWWECDRIGLVDYLARPGWKKVLFGKLVENDVYEAIAIRAYHDLQKELNS